MKAELIPMAGGPPIPTTKDLTLIGRREYCDVQLDDPSLSKRHCVLVKTEGLLMVRDLATTNGTKVKGQLVRWAALLPNDQISIGKLKFRVFLGPDDARSDLPPPPKKARRSPAPATKRTSGSATPPPKRKKRVAVPSQADPGDQVPIILDGPEWFDPHDPSGGFEEEIEEEIIDLQ